MCQSPSFVVVLLSVLVLGGKPNNGIAQTTQLLTDFARTPTYSKAPSVRNANEMSRFISNHSDWVVTCKEDATCEISTSVSNIADLPETSTLASLRLVGIIKDKISAPVFYVSTPLGLLLSKGVALNVDKRKIGNLTFRSCHLTGCLVPFRLTNNIRRAFQRGYTAHLTTYDLSANATNVDFSLLGFAKALRTATELVR